MAARSLASLSLSFGLVSIPVKLYSATESSTGVHFNLLASDGSRLKQQYISERSGKPVERADMVRGYEFEKDRFVLFSNEELKALQEAPSQSIDIVSFVPTQAVDPLYYDKAYFLAPDKRGGKPYALLLEAMRSSGRCALARWAWRGKQVMVQVRPQDDGLVLQQLLHADEVRSIRDLDIEETPVSQGELKLALQLIDQISSDSYDPSAYEDAEKTRILAAIERKIAGSEVVVQEGEVPASSAQVIDLMAALKASVSGRGRDRGDGGRGAGDRSDAATTGRAAGAAAQPKGAGRKATQPTTRQAGAGDAQVAKAARKGAKRATGTDRGRAGQKRAVK